MNLLRTLILIFPLVCLSAWNAIPKMNKSEKVTIIFQEEDIKFTASQKDFIRKVIITSEKEVRDLLPNLPDGVKIIVEYVDWDLDLVGGVTGRTETNSPPLVLVQISDNYGEGIIDSVYPALRATLFHELHHLARGWAIQDNKFSYGIPNAMVNEGLAVAFTEQFTGNVSEVNAYTEDADDWVKEILALPLDASYSDWVMGEHPDGRTYIGYRTGNYLVRKAMTKSGKNILEMSELAPNDIIKLAGY